jgi:hypothetical protein
VDPVGSYSSQSASRLVDLSSSVLIIRHMNVDKGKERETLELNGLLYSVQTPAMLTPTHSLCDQSQVMVLVHPSIKFGLSNDQLLLI